MLRFQAPVPAETAANLLPCRAFVLTFPDRTNFAINGKERIKSDCRIHYPRG